MNRILLAYICCGFISSVAMAEDAYEKWLTMQNSRGIKIEQIRVSSEKPLVATEDTDAEVASILKEIEALEEEISDHEKIEDSS